MVNLGHIDMVVIPVRTNPFDPNDALVEIDGHNQTICIALHVEDDAIGRHDARSRVGPFYIRGVPPSRLLDLIEPSIQRSLHRRLLLVSRQRLYELPQRAPCDDPHVAPLPRAHFGRNEHRFVRILCAARCWLPNLADAKELENGPETA
jgi:hypothetical protein